MTHAYTNRLIHATSPYLLQHAHNPVDWYEWGEEALMRARREDKPILVSIGYSSCHWCHVMEREVFENEGLAQKMNKYLVCIKIDREERPDIDQIYMDAVQAMGVHGGWPLNVFLTPDQKPFYGGTYFPPRQWEQVIEGIHKAFHERRGEVNESADQFAGHLARQEFSSYKKESGNELPDDLRTMYAKLENAFDRKWGGLDKAPKFVMPSVWLWLLRYHKITGEEDALNQLKLTLDRIARGGIYDQIAGGFARYSVDGYWFAPHFEKMLYDNAQMMSLYAEAFLATADESLREIIHETFEWLRSEMTHPDGGFYAALDADSEGVEGKFYVWTKQELEDILGKDAPLGISWYAVKDEGNWEHGNNILFRAVSTDSFLRQHNLSADTWRQKLRTIKDRLLVARDQRVRPGLDDKVITSWNAMMAVGLTDAYRATGGQPYLDAAVKNMRFLERELCDGTTLYRSWKGKRSSTGGFLDDYAYFIQACIRLYEVTFEEYWLERAALFTTHTIDHFLDSSDGFFFYTNRHGEKLIAQRKEIFDNVIPSSNSVMVRNLWQLGTLFDREEWKAMARDITLSLGHLIVTEPNYMSNWGIAYAEVRKGLAEVVIVGAGADQVRAQFQRHYEPFSLTLGTTTRSDLPLVSGKEPVDGETSIYVCYNKACRRPTTAMEDALRELKEV